MATFQTAVAGTTITAVWGNNVRDGLINTFATAAARTSAVTAPTESMLSYQLDTHQFYSYDGSAWVLVPRGMSVIKAADQAVSTSTVLVDDNHFAFTVLANAVYKVDTFLYYTADTAGDLKIGWSGPASATFIWNAGGMSSTAASVSAPILSTTGAITDTDILGGIGATTGTVARPGGLLTIAGTAGTFKMQWAQGTSAVTGTTVKAGSLMTLTRIA